MVISKALDDLIALGRDSVELSALLREFLDHGGVLARCQINESAAVVAGQVVVDCEPTDCFRRALSAFLAENPKFDHVGMLHDWLASSTPEIM